MKKRLLSIVIASMGMLLTVGCKKGEDPKASGSTSTSNPGTSEPATSKPDTSKPGTSKSSDSTEPSASTGSTDTEPEPEPSGSTSSTDTEPDSGTSSTEITALPELNLSDWVKASSGLVDGKYIIGANKADTLMIMSNHKSGATGTDITVATGVNNLTAVAYATGAAVSDYSYSVKISTESDNSKSVSIQNTYNTNSSPLENKYLNNGGPKDKTSGGTTTYGSQNKFKWSDTEVKWKVEDVADGIKLSQVGDENHTYIMALNTSSNLFGSYRQGQIQNLLFYKVG